MKLPDRHSDLFRPRLGPLIAAFLTILALLTVAEFSVDGWVRTVAPTDDRSAILANIHDGEISGQRAVILIGGSALDELAPWKPDPSVCAAGQPPLLRKLTYGGQTLAVSLGILDHLEAPAGSLVLLHVNYFRMGGSPQMLGQEVAQAALPLPSAEIYEEVLAGTGVEPDTPLSRLLYHAPFLYNHAEVRLWPLRSAVREQLSTAPLDIGGWAGLLSRAGDRSGFRPTAVRFETAEPLPAKRASMLERLDDETVALRDNLAFNLDILERARDIARRKGFILKLVDTPQDPGLVPDTAEIREIYEGAVSGYAELGIPLLDLRYGEDLQTEDFRDLVHVVTEGREKFRHRWNLLLRNEMPGYCGGENG